MFKINPHPIAYNNSNQTFKARLFAPDGQQIRSFENKDIDEMAQRGSKATDIYVKEFNSEYSPIRFRYENSIRLVVKNPLFGSYEFVKELNHDKPVVKGDPSSELFYMNLLTKSNGCCQGVESLENRALRMSLIDGVKYRNEYQKDPRKWGESSSLYATDILASMLRDYGNSSGFSDERINDFQEIAEDLTKELIAKGANCECKPKRYGR